MRRLRRHEQRHGPLGLHEMRQDTHQGRLRRHAPPRLLAPEAVQGRREEDLQRLHLRLSRRDVHRVLRHAAGQEQDQGDREEGRQVPLHLGVAPAPAVHLVALRRRCVQLRREQQLHGALAVRPGDGRPPERGRAGVHARKPERRRDQSEAPHAIRRLELQPQQRALHAPPSRRRDRRARRHPDPRPRLRGRRGELPHPGAEPPPACPGRGLLARGVGVRPALEPARGSRGPRPRRALCERASRHGLALRRRARTDAAPGARGGSQSPRGLLRYAGRSRLLRAAGRRSSSPATSTRS